MSGQDDGEDEGPDEGIDNMLFFGSMTFFLTNSAVMLYVLIDWIINVDHYSLSYSMGAVFFIILNLWVLTQLPRQAANRKRRWLMMIAAAVTFMTVLWMFHGLGQPWRTFLIAGIGYAGLFLIGLAWLRRPAAEVVE